MNCPHCQSRNYGPGPNFDNLRWIGCYDCGYGFKNTKIMSFSISEQQLVKINNWIKGHEKLPVGAIGGRYTYCFTPTSLGVIITVKDILANQEIDVTDYKDW